MSLMIITWISINWHLIQEYIHQIMISEQCDTRMIIINGGFRSITSSMKTRVFVSQTFKTYCQHQIHTKKL